MNVKVFINDTIIKSTFDCIELTQEYYGSPATLTFTVAKYSGLGDIHEGDKVCVMLYDSVCVFYGIVCEKSRDKEHHIKITAYDYLRYFANQHTWVYTNKRADQVVRELCEQFELPIGEIENTEVVIPFRNEDNQTLFDIVETALDISYHTNKEEYVLYANMNGINLRNVKRMTVDKRVIGNDRDGYQVVSAGILDTSNSENFEYVTSIDKDTFTQIKVRQDSGTQGEKYVYIADNSEAQEYWGLLRHVVDVDEGTNPIQMAHTLMDLKCRPTREFTLKGVKGNHYVQAGSRVRVSINLGDQVFNNVYCLCESVTHHFTADNYTMDLKFRDDGVRVIGEVTGEVLKA